MENSLEVGHPVLQTNGTAVLTSNTSRAGALNTLMCKYLLAYAIVMGQSTRVPGVNLPPKVPIGSKAHTCIPSIANNMTSPNGFFVTGLISATIFAPLFDVSLRCLGGHVVRTRPDVRNSYSFLMRHTCILVLAFWSFKVERNNTGESSTRKRS